MSDGAELVRFEREGAIATIVLNRPERRNALRQSMYGDIRDALRRFQDDESVRVVTLRGEGVDFCAGNDISDFHAFGARVEESDTDPLSYVQRDRTPSVDIVWALMEFDKPLVAAIQGNAVGFGATMLLHADSIIADPTAKLRFPFVNLALVPEAGSTALLQQRIGFLKAAEVLYNGDGLAAEEALRLGLVSEVVDTGAAHRRALEIARVWAAKPPRALQATKRLLKRDAEALADRVTEEFRVIAERTPSPEARAVFAAFLKR